MKILLLNSFYYPLLKDKGTGGSVRYCQSQHDVFEQFGHEVMHVTSFGSDMIYPGSQAILHDRVNIMLESRKDKSNVTKKMTDEVRQIYDKFKPDVVIDSCNKRTLKNFAQQIQTPYIFTSHNITPIGVKDTSQIDGQLKAARICHIGMSQLQNANYGNIFDCVVPVHLASDEFCVPKIRTPEGYAMHISRWDKYKAPWVVLNKFLKYTKDIEVHFFTTFDGNDLEGTENHLKKLQNDGRVIFHVDADRSDMLDHMASANVFLGNPIESAGITALEANQNGVPYLVHLNEDRVLAQSEYLVDYGIRKSIGDNYFEDFIDLYAYHLSDREILAEWTRTQYGPTRFYEAQMQTIVKAIAMRSSGYVNEFEDLF